MRVAPALVMAAVLAWLAGCPGRDAGDGTAADAGVPSSDAGVATVDAGPASVGDQPPLGAVRGGPIDGSITIEAVSVDGFPLPGLVAFVGTDGRPAVAGLTDLTGTARLALPGLRGPQTVTIGGGCSETVTFVDVDARSLRVPLIDTNVCGIPDSLWNPPPPALVSGTVHGLDALAAELVLDRSGCGVAPSAADPAPKCEIAVAVVSTTRANVFDPFGPQFLADSVVVVTANAPDFFLDRTRVGPIALVAVAGAFDQNSGVSRATKLGIRRGVVATSGVVRGHEDIDLDVDLDRDVTVALVGAPLHPPDPSSPQLPDVARVQAFVDLGSEGVFPLRETVGVDPSSIALASIPRGLPLTFVGGAFTLHSGIVGGTATLTEGSPVVAGSADAPWLVDDGVAPTPVGDVFSVVRGDGTELVAEVIAAVPGPDGPSLILDRPADFTGALLPYVIGGLSVPSSQLVAHATPDASGAITLGPFIDLPLPQSPGDAGVMVQRTLRWTNGPGLRADAHDLFLIDALGFNVAWRLVVDGARERVVVPRIPDAAALRRALPPDQARCLLDTPQDCARFGSHDFGALRLPADLPRGGLGLGHSLVAVPGFDRNAFTFDANAIRGIDAVAEENVFFVNAGE